MVERTNTPLEMLFILMIIIGSILSNRRPNMPNYGCIHKFFSFHPQDALVYYPIMGERQEITA